MDITGLYQRKSSTLIGSFAEREPQLKEEAYTYWLFCGKRTATKGRALHLLDITGLSFPLHILFQSLFFSAMDEFILGNV